MKPIGEWLGLFSPEPCLHCRAWVPDRAVLCSQCQTCFELAPTDGRPGREIQALWWYRQAAVDLIRAAKFQGDRRVVAWLSDRLLIRLDDWTKAGWINAQTFICPAPPHPLRRFRHGFDLPTAIAQHLPYRLWTGLGRRLGASQKKRNRADRLAKISRQLFLKPQSNQAAVAAGCQVILLDDVCTTGATVAACQKLLEAAGFSQIVPLVICLD